jgi:uncharacterized cupin superfamily protein
VRVSARGDAAPPRLALGGRPVQLRLDDEAVRGRMCATLPAWAAGSVAHMIPEASMQATEHGLAPAGDGWFVLDAHEARWRRRPGRGHSLPFTGWAEDEADFPLLGATLFALAAGEPIGMYHWERDAEAFLVVDGEATLLVEGQERSLRRWDFVHCPPGTRHMIVGAGEHGCTVLAAGSRAHAAEPCNGGGYVADEVAARHGAAVERDTRDAAEVYARFPAPEPVRYGGWLRD